MSPAPDTAGAANVIRIQKALNEAPNNRRMIRPVCLAVIVGVMADQIVLHGQFMAALLGMLVDIRHHFWEGRRGVARTNPLIRRRAVRYFTRGDAKTSDDQLITRTSGFA
jgi:hypothetical protein